MNFYSFLHVFLHHLYDDGCSFNITVLQVSLKYEEIYNTWKTWKLTGVIVYKHIKYFQKVVDILWFKKSPKFDPVSNPIWVEILLFLNKRLKSASSLWIL